MSAMRSHHSKSTGVTPWGRRAWRRRGTALVIAVSLLALFTTLGMLYVRAMSTEIEKSNLALRRARARNLAIAGVRAAIGDLERAVDQGQLVQILSKPRTYQFNTYTSVRTTAGRQMQPFENRRAVATVTITDESGKINLNHTPAKALKEVLGVDIATALGIRISLPGTKPKQLRKKGVPKQWLVGVHDLASRGLLTKEQFEKVDTSLVTTYTVTDHQNPKAYLNVNMAPAAVIAAVLNVSPEEADRIVAQRPYKSFAAFREVLGKDPATFALKSDPDSATGIPAALTLKSRCFRIISEAKYAAVVSAGENQKEYNRTYGRTEAVVLFDDKGGYQVVRWNTQRLEDAAQDA